MSEKTEGELGELKGSFTVVKASYPNLNLT